MVASSRASSDQRVKIYEEILNSKDFYIIKDFCFNSDDIRKNAEALSIERKERIVKENQQMLMQEKWQITENNRVTEEKNRIKIENKKVFFKIFFGVIAAFFGIFTMINAIEGLPKFLYWAFQTFPSIHYHWLENILQIKPC